MMYNKYRLYASEEDMDKFEKKDGTFRSAEKGGKRYDNSKPFHGKRFDRESPKTDECTVEGKNAVYEAVKSGREPYAGIIYTCARVPSPS